jgi:hypothetical protein
MAPLPAVHKARDHLAARNQGVPRGRRAPQLGQDHLCRRPRSAVSNVANYLSRRGRTRLPLTVTNDEVWRRSAHGPAVGSAIRGDHGDSLRVRLHLATTAAVSAGEQFPGGLGDVSDGDSCRIHQFFGGPGAREAADSQVDDLHRVTSLVEGL